MVRCGRRCRRRCRCRCRTTISDSVLVVLSLLLSVLKRSTTAEAATAATAATSRASCERRSASARASMLQRLAFSMLTTRTVLVPCTKTLAFMSTSSSRMTWRARRRTLTTRRHDFQRGNNGLQSLSMTTSVADDAKANNSSNSSNSWNTTSSILEEKEQSTESAPPVPPPVRPKKSSPFKKQRQMHRHTVTALNDAPLDWERFEFSESPKWDRRFDANTLLVSDIATTDDKTGRTITKEEGLERLFQQEVIQDVLYTSSLQQGHAAWQSLDAQLVQDAIAIIQPCINANRVAKIHKVLSQRTRHARFLFENPANPSNVWACLRTIEAFGLQHVDIVVQSDRYRGKAALSQKRGLRTAMGSAQWLTLSQHASTASAIHAIQQQVPNVAFYAADLHPSAIDIRCMPWTTSTTTSRSSSSSSSSSSNSDDTINDISTDAASDPILVDDTNEMNDRPICIVMGNEESGISSEMRQRMDQLFTLPMVGFAESFNLSVATAITLAHMSAASTSSDSDGSSMKGPLRPGDLTHHERQCLLLKGLLNSLPQKRMAKALLKQAGIVLPPELSV